MNGAFGGARLARKSPGVDDRGHVFGYDQLQNGRLILNDLPTQLGFGVHSMEPRERELALEVLSLAWERLANSGMSILATVRAEAAALPERYADVSTEFAEHIGSAAVWYLDRATRRVGDPDRDGLTPAQRAVNLAQFGAEASGEDVERLFAVAVALNEEDV